MSTHDSLIKDNQDMTRVGPGTIMGNLMRHYWLPAMRSDELVAGGAPVRLLLLGEKLIAARSPSGAITVMDHRCPHRNASLFYGRNEEGGLRCVYHGWQYNAEGQCIDVPNQPEGEEFARRVRNTAYKTFEKHSVVWVFMGDQSNPPAPPMLEILDAEEGDIELEFAQRECNYLQSLEGDIDTSHLGFLHLGSIEPHHLQDSDLTKYVVANRRPEIEVVDAPWGTSYCAAKVTDQNERYLRIANFIFPCWTQAPQGKFETNVMSRAWVPMDDEHTMMVTMLWRKRPRQFPAMRDGTDLPGSAELQLHPNTTDWLGRFKTVQSQFNDYLIDRDAQSNGLIYSGISTIGVQDQAVTESMGAITDRAREHLSPSDIMVARTRRRLLRAARDLDQNGVLPPGIEDPSILRQARSGELVVATHRTLTETYPVLLAESFRLEGSRTAQPA